jgi:hypothetical protein
MPTWSFSPSSPLKQNFQNVAPNVLWKAAFQEFGQYFKEKHHFTFKKTSPSLTKKHSHWTCDFHFQLSRSSRQNNSVSGWINCAIMYNGPLPLKTGHFNSFFNFNFYNPDTAQYEKNLDVVLAQNGLMTEEYFADWVTKLEKGPLALFEKLTASEKQEQAVLLEMLSLEPTSYTWKYILNPFALYSYFLNTGLTVEARVCRDKIERWITENNFHSSHWEHLKAVEVEFVK